jgi:hypothetical protein
MSYLNRYVTLVTALAIACSASVAAQIPDASKSANPELVGNLAKELQVTPQQAEGAAGALFETARGRMPASDWSNVSAAVPGMDGLLKAAPAMGATGTGGALGKIGGMAGAAASFQKLGLKTGGANVASLLAGALK